MITSLTYEYDRFEEYTINDFPHWHEMVNTLQILDENNENVLFLLANANNVPRLIYECIECDLTCQYIKEYTLAHSEEVILHPLQIAR